MESRKLKDAVLRRELRHCRAALDAGFRRRDGDPFTATKSLEEQSADTPPSVPVQAVKGQV